MSTYTSSSLYYVCDVCKKESESKNDFCFVEIDDFRCIHLCNYCQKKIIMTKIDSLDFLEDLSNLQHNIWVEWSKSLAKSEKLTVGRLSRWEKMWIDYYKLSENIKELDRKQAKKVIQLIEDSL